MARQTNQQTNIRETITTSQYIAQFTDILTTRSDVVARGSVFCNSHSNRVFNVSVCFSWILEVCV